MSPVHKDHYDLLNHEARPRHLGSAEGRMDQFTGGHFADVNLSALLFAHRLDDTKHVELEVWSAPGRTKPPFSEAKRQTYKKAQKGESFGPSWTNHWFKVTLHIPKDWEDYERVQLEFDCSGEAMVFNTDGDALQGLTGGYGGDRRVEFIIPPSARKSGTVHYYLEASCNGMFGQDGGSVPDENRYYKLNSADLVVPNMEAWRLMWDFDTLHQTFHELPGDTPLRDRCLRVNNDIMNAFRRGDLESVKKCRKIAEELLGEHWEKSIQKDSEHAAKQDGTLWAVGHCHIDTAWLWPFSVTQQKSARSWSTQCDLMDRYPEHRFSATQAQQFKWVEQLYPSLFERIKEKVSEGNFQPIGATWVEMDCNMPSGEALVRQFLYGQRYFKSKFGFISNIFVLPDTFGYASQLPQIARSAGCINFFTQKLSWNNTNNFPNTTFNWVGLDSTQILAHLTPVNNYNSQCNMDDIRRGMTGHKNKEVTNQALLLFGNGDGGGGPTPPMMEKLRRARAIGKHPFSGGQIPLVKMGGSFEEFYESVRKETDNGKLLPNWRGELYAEFHRGTYTTHASIKRGNRKGEILMREVEFMATAASLENPSYKYPKAKIDEAWEDLLLCQFHDVLPGSGIHMIYEDAEERYANVQSIGQNILKEAYKHLFPGSVDISEIKSLEGMEVFAVNPLFGYERREVIKIENPNINVKGVQKGKEGGGYVLVHTDGAHGVGEIKATEEGLQSVQVTKEGDVFIMSNGSLEMKMKDGRITSIYDKQIGREIIPDGQSGGMVIMEDTPNAWDAWDVDQFHLEMQTHLKLSDVSIAENGPLRGTVVGRIQLGQSSIELRVSMDAIPASMRADARSMIKFDALIDWRERHKFLKFELPMNVSSEFATYDTQFGVVQRPTHRNTSWDNAKFEVCGHRFADLSEFGYGVALLNESKYGYATEGNIMRLSLLRSPTEPDPHPDVGTHNISWAIYPHKGTFAESDVPAVAAAFNIPLKLRAVPGSVQSMKEKSPPALPNLPWNQKDSPNIFLDTVKRSEDEKDGSISTILRYFEYYGGHAKHKVKFTLVVPTKVELTNILEEPIEELKIHSEKGKDGKMEYWVDLDFRGFEVKTLKVYTEAKKKGSGEGWVKL